MTQSNEKQWFHQIIALAGRGEFDKARQELDTMGDFKDAPEYNLLYCKILLSMSQLPEALDRIDDAIVKNPGDWRLHDVKCLITQETRNTDALAIALAQLELTSPPVERLWKYREGVAVLKADFAEAINLLETAIECGDLGMTTDIAFRLFSYHRKLGDSKRAFYWLAQYFESDPEATIDVTLLINFLLDLSPEDYGEKKIVELRERFPANNTILFTHVRLLLTTGKVDKIPAVIEDSLSILNKNTLHSLENLLSTTDIEITTEKSGKNPGEEPARSGSMMRGEFANCLVYEGPEKARNSFQYVTDNTEREICKQMLEAIPPISEHHRTLVSNFPKNQGWVIGAGDNSIGTVIVFTGMAGRAGIHNTFFDSYFAALNLDAIFLRDTDRNTYLGGVNGLGSTAEEMTERLIELSPSEPLYCVSFSGGSFGALGCCLNTKLKSVVMFSPYTYLFSSNKAHASAMSYLQKNYKSVTTDFMACFKSTGPEFPIHLVYGTEDDDCAHQVDRVSHIGNISGHRVGSSTHSSLVYDLAFRGHLLSLLRGTLGLN